MDKKTYLDFLSLNRKKWEGSTPCFVINGEQLDMTIETVTSLFPGEVVYSHKTNPNPIITKAVERHGCGFLLSSADESEELIKEVGVKPDKLIFQSPSLTVGQFEKIKSLGISRFSIDSEEQLKVILSSLGGIARKPEILIRINTGVTVANPELCYSTDSYLGFPMSEALGVFKRMNVLREKGTITLGLHNHLFSQNTFADLWQKNLNAIAGYVEKLHGEGIVLDAVDFGGGYPIDYGKGTLAFTDVVGLIKDATDRMKRTYPELHFIFEPGRKIAGESVTLVAEVAHVKEFRGNRVAILDCSVYNASLDTLIVSLYLPAGKVGDPGADMEYVIRGSTPDSLDVFAKKITLPELKSGDHVAFFHAGAYSLWSDFISLKKPKYILI